MQTKNTNEKIIIFFLSQKKIIIHGHESCRIMQQYLLDRISESKPRVCISEKLLRESSHVRVRREDGRDWQYQCHFTYSDPISHDRRRYSKKVEYILRYSCITWEIIIHHFEVLNGSNNLAKYYNLYAINSRHARMEAYM